MKLINLLKKIEVEIFYSRFSLFLNSQIDGHNNEIIFILYTRYSTELELYLINFFFDLWFFGFLLLSSINLGYFLLINLIFLWKSILGLIVLLFSNYSPFYCGIFWKYCFLYKIVRIKVFTRALLLKKLPQRRKYWKTLISRLISKK